jgi:hypothetical protein
MRKEKSAAQADEIVYVLPAEFNTLDTFISENKTKLMEYILTAIDNAISKKQSTIEIFNFSDSEYIITLSSESFASNLDNIYHFYLSTEQYELCARIKHIREKLTTYEKK